MKHLCKSDQILDTIMQSEQPQKITFRFEDQDFTVRLLDQKQGIPIVYLHGWGTELSWFIPLMDALLQMGRHILVDLPGFGETTRPQSVWGTEKYAEFIHAFLQEQGIKECYVVGHSFGGRIAIRLAHQYPAFIKGMILIAAAGLKKKIPFSTKLRVRSIRWIANMAKSLLPKKWGYKIKNKLYDKIASNDYKQAGDMRPIFVKVVNEDLTKPLKMINAPSLLLWGGEDTETPPNIGKRMQQLLAEAKYVELPGFDHFTILSRAKHQVGFQIRQFLKGFHEDES